MALIFNAGVLTAVLLSFSLPAWAGDFGLKPQVAEYLKTQTTESALAMKGTGKILRRELPPRTP
jgi:hypothetical protein